MENGKDRGSAEIYFYGLRPLIKVAAQLSGKSVSGFVRTAVVEKLERDMGLRDLVVEDTDGRK